MYQHFFRVTVVILVAVISFASSAHGDERSGFYAGAGLGKASSTMHGYRIPSAIDVYGGYAWDGLGAEIGFSDMDRFKVHAAKESYMDVKIWHAALRARYTFNSMLFLEGQLGLARWDARAVLIHQRIGREHDLKPMWGAEAGLQLAGAHFGGSAVAALRKGCRHQHQCRAGEF